MKEPEFIELLNLYIDHEIGPGDAARLEVEVTTNSERRHVYHQYCLMQKGCSLLAGKFQESAPEAPRVAQRAPQRVAWNTGLFAAGLAAACVAFLLVARVRTASPSAAPATGLVASVKDTAPAPALAAEAFGGELQPVVDLRSLSLNAVNPAGRPEFAASANDQFAWLNRVQFAPIARVQINALQLKANPSLPESEVSLTPDAGVGETQIENVSFKFQR